MHSFKLNNGLIKFVCLACVIVAYGCDNTIPEEENKSTDARVLKFTLSDNTKIAKSLSKYNFAIDHLAGQNSNGVIQNNDSLPLGTNINQNVLASIAFNGASKAQLIYNDKEEEERKDYSPTDSINFSRGVQLEVTAYDGKTKKTYQLKVNVHKEDPDSVTWNETRTAFTGIVPNKEQVTFAENTESTSSAFNSFYSDNNTLSRINLLTGQTITYVMQNPIIKSMVQTPNGYYLLNDGGELMHIGTTLSEPTKVSQSQFATIYGYVTDRNTNYLIVTDKTSGAVFALNLTDHTSVLTPVDTPAELATLSSFVRANNHPTSMNYKATTIVGQRPGLAYLSTFQFYVYDGKLHISNDMAYPLDKSTQLPAVEAPAMFFYNKTLWAVANEGSTNSIYVSADLGRTWIKQKSKLTIPNSYSARKYASTCVLAQKHIYLFGGETDGGYISEIWRGKINRVDHKYYFPAK